MTGLPTNFMGLVVFAAVLVPGFVHYSERRKRVCQGHVSTLAETASLITISILTNGIALLCFAGARALLPRHTPDVGRLLAEGGDYLYPRVGYVFAWAFVILVFSCSLGWLLGARPGRLRNVRLGFAPTIVDASIWYSVFEEAPEDSYVYVGVDLADGTYLGGRLDWYSTEVADTADRDIALGEPLTLKREGQEEKLEWRRAVVSARDIRRMYVSYLTEEECPGDSPVMALDVPDRFGREDERPGRQQT